jgi:hypothetical protein
MDIEERSAIATFQRAVGVNPRPSGADSHGVYLYHTMEFCVGGYDAKRIKEDG